MKTPEEQPSEQIAPAGRRGISSEGLCKTGQLEQPWNAD